VNACNSESLGRELGSGGMRHVSCWRGSVHDTVAERFSDQFYKTVIEKPGDYQGAFDQGKLAAKNLQNAKRHNGARKPDGTPCFSAWQTTSCQTNVLRNQRRRRSGSGGRME